MTATTSPPAELGAASCSAKFTTDDLHAVWHYHADYFVDVLNRDMTLEDAREALRGLIGSKWEPASPNAKADSTANQCPP
jgi:hypothetical protein